MVYVAFRNIYGELVAESDIHRGWWITPEDLAMFFKKFPAYIVLHPQVHYLETYGYSFPIEMIEDICRMTDEEAKIFLKWMFVEFGMMKSDGKHIF